MRKWISKQYFPIAINLNRESIFRASDRIKLYNSPLDNHNNSYLLEEVKLENAICYKYDNVLIIYTPSTAIAGDILFIGVFGRPVWRSPKIAYGL